MSPLRRDLLLFLGVAKGLEGSSGVERELSCLFAVLAASSIGGDNAWDHLPDRADRRSAVYSFLLRPTLSTGHGAPQPPSSNAHRRNSRLRPVGANLRGCGRSSGAVLRPACVCCWHRTLDQLNSADLA